MPVHFISSLLACLLTQPLPLSPGHDLYGDPLPPGAIARLGTTRFRHEARVMGVAFLPDGKRLLAADESGKVLLWDVRTGRRLWPVIDQRDTITALALAPDGKTAAIATASKGLALWDMATARSLHTFDTPDFVRQVVFSPDGQFLAAATSTNIFFWQRKTGQLVRRMECRLGGYPCLTLSGENRVLAAASRGLFLWDIATGVQLLGLRSPDDEGREALPVTFTVEGSQFLATDPNRRGLTLRNAVTGSVVRQGQATAEVWRLAISPDGRILATGDGLGGITLWSALTLAERCHIRIDGRRAPEVLAFSPDAQLLAAGTGNDVSLWETATGREVGVPFRHHGEVNAVACSPDGRLVATAGACGNVRLWERMTGREVRCLRGHAGPVWAVAFAPDGKSLASGGTDGTLRQWDLPSGEEQRPLFEKDSGPVDSLAYSPDGRLLVAGKPGTFAAWDLAAGRQLREFPGTVGRVSSLAWSPDGKTLVAANVSQTVSRWQAASGAPLPELRVDQPRELVSAVFAPDGRMIATAGNDEMVRLWDSETGKELQQMAACDGATCRVVFSPDGRTLAVLDLPRGRVIIIEVSTGAKRCEVESLLSGLHSAAFSPDSRTLITGHDDGTALVWDLYTLPQGRLTRAKDTKPEALWRDLASQDAPTAYAALKSLIAAPREAVSLLEKRLAPARVAPPDHLARLIADLDHDEFAIRERATAALAEYGEQSAVALRQALATQPGAEVTRRIEDLLSRPRPGEMTSDRLPQARALEALEYMNTPETFALLERLTQGAPNAWLTREAKTVLNRKARQVKRFR
jgi:WD40 repeat protein